MMTAGEAHIPFFPWVDRTEELASARAVGSFPRADGPATLTRSIAEQARSQWPQAPVTFRDAELADQLGAVFAELSDGSIGVPRDAFRYVHQEGVTAGGEIPQGTSSVMCDPAFVEGCIRDGGSRAFLGADRYVPAAARLVAGLGRDLEAQCNLSFFHASPEFRGFPAHYDVFHSVLVQVRGSKTWVLRPPPVADPGLEHEWPEIEHLYDQGALESAEGVAEIQLAPGDVLWIPTGWVHSGLSSPEGSVHGTFGVRPPRLHELLAYLVDSASSVPDLRRQLPPHAGSAAETIAWAMAAWTATADVVSADRRDSAYATWRHTFRDTGLVS